MWTESLIELFASAYAPQGWSACPTCKVEYCKPILAYGCWKAHRRVHERVYAGVDTEQVKHEVAFDGGRPLCRSYTKRAEIAVTVVQMAEPPNCSRCGHPIQDPPFVEIVPSKLPLSERHRDSILNPTRQGLATIQDHRVHKALREWHPDTGSTVVDPRLFKQFGPIISEGKGGIPRTATGYIAVEDAEEVPCSLPSS